MIEKWINLAETIDFNLNDMKQTLEATMEQQRKLQGSTSETIQHASSGADRVYLDLGELADPACAQSSSFFIFRDDMRSRWPTI